MQILQCANEAACIVRLFWWIYWKVYVGLIAFDKQRTFSSQLFTHTHTWCWNVLKRIEIILCNFNLVASININKNKQTKRGKTYREKEKRRTERRKKPLHLNFNAFFLFSQAHSYKQKPKSNDNRTECSNLNKTTKRNGHWRAVCVRVRVCVWCGMTHIIIITIILNEWKVLSN